jgi:MoxR-like ATPase
MSTIKSSINAQLANSNFVKFDNFSDSLSLSVLSGIPILYYGKGGYGKTEMILESFKAIRGSQGMLECDPETNASHIKGGAIAKTTKSDKYDLTEAHYNITASVLQKHKFFFEEALDASFNALSVLKAVITNRMLNISGEEIKSINKVLVAATNLNPIELKESLPEIQQNSYDAFLQRFLIVNHGWDSHDAADYALLDDDETVKYDISPVSIDEIDMMREDVSSIVLSSSIKGLLQHLAQKSGENGSVISPRAYKWTQKLIKSAAYLRDASTADMDDLRILNYLSYWDTSLLSGLEEEMERKKQYDIQVEKINEFERRINRGFHKLNNPEKGKLVNAAIIWKLAKQLETEISNSGKYADSLTSRINDVKKKCCDLVAKAANERDNSIMCGSESL